MNYIYWGLMFTGFILWMILLDYLSNLRVYGKVLTDDEVEAFFKKWPLDKVDKNILDERILSWATYKIVNLSEKELQGLSNEAREPVFIARAHGYQIFSKYYIHSVGQVDRFGKWSKKIDERFAELKWE
jgi:hypothetical protein